MGCGLTGPNLVMSYSTLESYEIIDLKQVVLRESLTLKLVNDKKARWSTLYCNKTQVPSRMFDSRRAVLQNERAAGEEAMID